VLPAPSGAGRGVLLSSSSDGSSLTYVDPASPGTVLATETISGVTAETTLVGIDVRSATGTIYALGSNGQTYVLGAPKAATPTVRPAEPIGVPAAEVATSAAGFDVNPAVDRIRFVSGTSSIVINPNSGTVTVGASTAYGESDPGEGTTPDIRSAAYTNRVTGGSAASTALFDLDTERDTLVAQNTTTGVLTTIGPLGSAIDQVGGFDLAADGTAYAVQRDGAGPQRLLVVNLTTGVATLVGSLPDTGYVGFALT
jgi:hypothetical protein